MLVSVLSVGALNFASTPGWAAPLPGAGECAQAVSGLSGTVTKEGNYCLIAFKGPTQSSGSSGTWTPPVGVTSVDVLIVGGGGGGGRFGGGGAGAFLEMTAQTVSPGTPVAVTIGSGGGGYGNLAGAVAGSNGSSSGFGPLTAFGGGGGSSAPQTLGGAVVDADSPGGSGGGAVASPIGDPKVTGQAAGTSNVAGASVAGRPAGTAGEGLRNAGGAASPVFVYLQNANWSVTTAGGASGVGLSVSIWQGGGGGGSGGPGAATEWSSNGLVGKSGDSFHTTFRPGNGGVGSATTLLSPTSAGDLGVGEVNNGQVFFAGGGAGFGNFDAATTEPKSWDFTNGTFLSYDLVAVGGLGGGGGGSGRTNDGVANSGGGGRGGGHAGGSGVVLIRYLLPGSVAPDDSPLEGTDTSSERNEGREGTSPSAVGGIGLELLGGVGSAAETIRIEAGGVELSAGTTYTLTLSRPETVLVTDQVGDSGSFYHLVNVPGPLAPGTYSIVLRAVQPDDFVLELRRDFVVAGDGTIIDLGINVVGGGPAVTGPDPSRLQTTGEEAEGMPWWALMLQLLGLLLVVYSIRATRMVDTEDVSDVVAAVRTPWEILATPITVPGIDYVPGSQGPQVAPTFADTMRELDLAVSKVIAFEIKKLRYHAAVRVIAPVRSWSQLD